MLRETSRAFSLLYPLTILVLALQSSAVLELGNIVFDINMRKTLVIHHRNKEYINIYMASDFNVLNFATG